MKLCHMISVLPTARKRSIKNEPKNRALNLVYFLKRENTGIRVCQTFFRNALGLTNHRISHVAKIICQGEVPKENRGGDHTSAKSATKREKVVEFIGQLKGQESHYNRAKSKRIYLPAHLSIARLHKMFTESVDSQYKVSYLMFRKIFLTKFNIGFSSPASDCCGQCTRLTHMIKIENDPKKKSELSLQYRVHNKRVKCFYEMMKEKPEDAVSLCFDLQQVQPLPRTPISDAFYSHQISFYSLCCVGMNSKNPTFYLWTEDLASRGCTEIGSALLSHLNEVPLANKTVIRLFCDGCGGQNKNSHIVHTLLYWLKFESPLNITQINLTFPVRGHSFMPADRAFGRVEKLLRKHPTIETKQGYHKLYAEVGAIKILGQDWFIKDIKELQTFYKKVDGISDLKRIVFKKTRKNNRNNVTVTCYQHYRFESTNEIQQSLLKKNKSDQGFQLNNMELHRSIPDKKKKTLRKLMAEQFGENWESQENLKWYQQILCTAENQSDNSHLREDHHELDEQCDCLEEEDSLHI
ncbi:uncharacterized protein LOC116165583 [Photinus pyralis]|uniref:uncharacterized protein LOC116165583 n=1 Tax=Photinus pyralis TaxID=7054 RepID=UPI0012673545|nr:uncharacterized protein LOC116165583 [Photinus pyralis]